DPATLATPATASPSDVIMSIHPSPAAVHTTGLTPAELHAITRGAAQAARDGASAWVYAARRAAQPVLDYLYLGPASAVKDTAWLAREGITMVLCARDARFAAGGGAAAAGMLVAGVRRAVQGMAVEVQVVDVADGRELVAAFSRVVALVNEHVLRVARAAGAREEEEGDDGRKAPARGKVLVVCETGNGRSAAMVAAYLMAMFGLDTVQAVQFLQLQRFCVALGDELKFVLQAYGDILRARGDVMGGYQQADQQEGIGRLAAQSKRRLEHASGNAGELGADDMVVDEMDEERYANRTFAPFVE
ncbi:uncharacterized protein THITE_25447, partial [Thermothielavioides terrestris NRRL 8126]